MPIDPQNPWLTAGTGGVEPAPGGASPLPPGAWGGLGPGISNERGAGDLSKWLDPKNYANWTRDQWRAAMTQAPYEYNSGTGILSQLEKLIGTHALNNHKNYFNAGGNGYLPGHFDYNTGKMVYNGIDQGLVDEVNNRPFSVQAGSYSGAPVNPMTGELGGTMMTGTPSLSQANMQQGGAYYNKPTNITPQAQPSGFQQPTSTGSVGQAGGMSVEPKALSNPFQPQMGQQKGLINPMTATNITGGGSFQPGGPSNNSRQMLKNPFKFNTAW